MTLDDLKTLWAGHGATLERSLAINERVLRELLLRKARRALWPHLGWRALEVLLGLAAVALTAPVVLAHRADGRYLVVGGLTVACWIAVTALGGYLLCAGAALRYDQPLTALRRRLDQLALAEYHALKWALLGGVLTWLPLALLVLEALTGAPALARAPAPWLWANLGFGVVVLVAGHAWSRRVVETSDMSPRARRIVDALAGRSLRAARAHAAELAAFERP